MAWEADRGRLGASAGPNAVLLADGRDGPDAWGAAEAVRPLAELCLSAEVETPFALGLVGGPGMGKSFALRRLVETVERQARAGRPGLISKAIVAFVDVAAQTPASAVAAAVYAALETDYAALAEEAAHATVDPRSAAAAASERHDEIVARLEQERRARDEAEARRARLAETLLHHTPGSRVDAFVRAGRPAIEAKLRRFGFDGDADATYRSLVGELASSRASSRVGLFLRALWAYRGQTRLIVLAALAVALWFGLHWLRTPAIAARLLAVSASLAPAVDWIKTHDDGLEYAGEALIVLAIASLLLNFWRAASFTGLLFRGVRMLNLDMRERRRELDASAERLERRVATLQIEAEAAGQRAEAMARKSGAGSAPSRPRQALRFVAAGDGHAEAARALLDDLSRAMIDQVAPAPQRLLIAIDGLERLPAEQARRFLDAATRLAGRGFVVIAAVDLTAIGAARENAERWFDVVFDASAPDGALAAPWSVAAPAAVAAKPIALSGALDEAEVGALKAASGLIGARPRALKRFYNAYRLARLADAPRPAVALSLAALMAPEPDAAAAWRWALAGEGECAPPPGPPALAAAFAAMNLNGVSKADARRALAAARRFAPWG